MNKFKTALLLGLMLNFLQANDTIFISPKVALKMIDKKEITFLALDNNILKIKGSKKLDMKVLETFDILGRSRCDFSYVCSASVEQYMSELGIGFNQSLVLYDNSYGINATTLYIILESMGHENISILRGTLKDISKLDPNMDKYNKYKNEISLNGDAFKITEIRKKMNILKPHLLLQDSNETMIETMEGNYTIKKENLDYFLSKVALKKLVNKIRLNESNITIIDACEMIDIVGNANGSYKAGVKSLSWKELIDKRKGHLKSKEELEKLFKKLELSKNDNAYIYCMSGAQKAFYVMMALRELGYSKVEAFTGDWNTWVGEIDE